MNATSRTATIISALALGLGGVAPVAHADPVGVEVVSHSYCIADTGATDHCDVQAEIPGVRVRVAEQCVGVLVDSCNL